MKFPPYFLLFSEFIYIRSEDDDDVKWQLSLSQWWNGKKKRKMKKNFFISQRTHFYFKNVATAKRWKWRQKWIFHFSSWSELMFGDVMKSECCEEGTNQRRTTRVCRNVNMRKISSFLLGVVIRVGLGSIQSFSSSSFLSLLRSVFSSLHFGKNARIEWARNGWMEAFIREENTAE